MPTKPNTNIATPPPMSNLTGKERPLSWLFSELCCCLPFLAWISFQNSCWNSFIFSLLSNFFKSVSQLWNLVDKSVDFKLLSVKSLVMVWLVSVWSWVIVWLPSSWLSSPKGIFGRYFLLLFLVIICSIFLGSLIIFWTFI